MTDILNKERLTPSEACQSQCEDLRKANNSNDNNLTCLNFVKSLMTIKQELESELAEYKEFTKIFYNDSIIGMRNIAKTGSNAISGLGKNTILKIETGAPNEDVIKSIKEDTQKGMTVMNSTLKEYVGQVTKLKGALEETIRKNQELKQKNKELEQQAMTDVMTDFYNKRAFEMILPKMIQQSKEESLPLSMLFIDIDQFKQLNDTHGHHIGDIAITSVAKIGILKILEQHIPDKQKYACIRYAGDEYVILIKDMNISKATELANRIRNQHADIRKEILMKSPDINQPDMTKPLNVTLSIGVYQYQGETMEEFIQKADAQLYRAKEVRNTVASPIKSPFLRY
ncbi:MAG: GGDEF domain-containing protein [Desulfobacterales bacterium]|nr:GGDEF domain-containing protein [Desulfobacterales bacterium]